MSSHHKIHPPEGLHVITYPAMPDVPRELAQYLSRLLHNERRRRGTRTNSKALTCFRQAVLGLHWFRQDVEVTALARSRSTDWEGGRNGVEDSAGAARAAREDRSLAFVDDGDLDGISCVWRELRGDGDLVADEDDVRGVWRAGRHTRARRFLESEVDGGGSTGTARPVSARSLPSAVPPEEQLPLDYITSTADTGYMTRTLGELIRHRRLELHLTQGQLAQLVNKSQVAVSEWERDVVVPSDMRSLADALELPNQELAMAAAAKFLTDDPFEQAVWQAERLTMKQREALLIIYQGMLRKDSP